MIGAKLSPVLKEIEDALWEFDAAEVGQPNFNDEAIVSASKIFMSVLMDKMWNLQCEEGMDIDDRCSMAKKAGNDLRKLIKVYTGLDSFDFYKKWS